MTANERAKLEELHADKFLARQKYLRAMKAWEANPNEQLSLYAERAEMRYNEASAKYEDYRAEVVK